MNTTQQKRRELAFERVDEMVAEVERLASGRVTVSGNHDFASIVRHLALTNEMTTGRMVPPKPPLILRILLPFIRSSIFKRPVKPGIKLPPTAESVFWPKQSISTHDAVAMFKDSVAYLKSHGPLPVHPFFGKASREQIERLICNHGAMHLSFVHPE